MTALEYATEKHKGQTRKDGKDYITHPIEVAKYASVYAIEEWEYFLKYFPADLSFFFSILSENTLDEDLDGEDLDELERRFKQTIEDVSLLHDTEEDTDATLDEIEALFGVVVRHAVDALSKRPGENYFDFIMRCRENFIAKLVKRADLSHNLSNLNEGSMKDKYRLAKYILENDV